MAANHSGKRDGAQASTTPVMALMLAGAGTALVMFGLVVAAWLICVNSGPANTPAGPVVNAPAPPNVAPITPAPKDVPAWWENVPDSNLASTVALLRAAVPADQPLLAELADKADIVRVTAYRKLTAKAPELIRNAQTKDLLGALLKDCYALDPTDANVVPLRDWIASQVPLEDVEFPPSWKVDGVERSFWALDVGTEALTHKAIRLDRAKMLAQELGKAFGITVEPGTAREELKSRTEKLLAHRCYRNLAPTAAKSLEDALAIREALLKIAPQHLSPSFREKFDIEVAFAGLPGAGKSWPAYSALLRDCLNSKDANIDLAIVELYAQADPELAAKMEPMLAGKWQVVADTKLKQPAKAKAIRKVLGVPDPDDRLTLLGKYARQDLDNATSPVNKPAAMLQETARLAHASTLACALFQKDAGTDRFDELITKVPVIDQGKQPAANVKGENPKQPDDMGGPVTKAGLKVYHDKLSPTVKTKAYSVAFKRGKTYSIDLVSGAFDAYLYLQNSKGQPLAEDDDSGGNLNARIIHVAMADDNYKILATSLGGSGAGAYTLSIQEVQGGMPGLGMPGPGFPFGPGFPPRRFFMAKFGFPPPGFFDPPFMGPGPPGVGPAPPQQPAGDAPAPQIDSDDLAALHDKNPAKTRVGAFQNIATKLKDELKKSDLSTRNAQLLAKYLLTIKGNGELEDVASALPLLASSRSLLLALADKVDQPDAEQRASEAVVGALAGQPLQLGKDDWALQCRRLLLLAALDLSGRHRKAAEESAGALRNFYAEQGVSLGMGKVAFKKMPRTAQVMESVIKHLAAQLDRQVPAGHDRDYLSQVPRRLLAVQSVAQNDLEQTVMLQAVWVEVLSIYLTQQSPERARQLQQAREEWGTAERPANILEQLRSGEQTVLRLWMLAHDVK